MCIFKDSISNLTVVCTLPMHDTKYKCRLRSSRAGLKISTRIKACVISKAHSNNLKIANLVRHRFHSKFSNSRIMRRYIRLLRTENNDADIPESVRLLKVWKGSRRGKR